MRRMTRMAVAVLGACGLSLSIALAHEGHDEAKARVGQAAPDFTLVDVDGKEHKLADLKGKVVVLEWTNYECPFVMRHQRDKHTMQKTFAMFEGQNVVWLAIDSTSAGKPSEQTAGHTNEKIKAWAENEDVKLPYPVLRDADGAVGRLYGARTTPHMFVIDKHGVLAYAGAIDDDPPGTKAEPTNYVAAAVKSALADSTVEVASTKPYGCSVKYADH